MTRIALITTTINLPRNLEAWRKCLTDDDVIVVAGDEQTDHQEVERWLESLPGENAYLDPQYQATLHPELSRVIGWRSIQRRNLATLHALRYQPDVILTVDDDNWPLDARPQVGDEIHRILTEPTRQHDTVSSSAGWYNPCQFLEASDMIYHRGYPHWVRDVTPAHHSIVTGRVGVLALMWLGDPDVDALDRYASADSITVRDWVPDMNVTLAPGTWCPFNSQATAFRAELAPALLYWPGVGRYDDIWASFLAQRVMQEHNLLVQFGKPLVVQRRAEHFERDFAALLRDLDGEMLGMKHTEVVINAIRRTQLAPTAKSLMFDYRNTLTIRDHVELVHAALTQPHPAPVPSRTARESFHHWRHALADLTVMSR